MGRQILIQTNQAEAVRSSLSTTSTTTEADIVLWRLRQTRYEPGDHIVCGCGQTHEADYCPTADGDGVAR